MADFALNRSVAPDAEEVLSRIGAVVIGRNEGTRLEACLRSLHGQVGRIVYVDSGSTDDSVALARQLGAEVVELDPDHPFTAARARNLGLAALGDTAPPAYVQFVDGDCVVAPDWVASAAAHLDTHHRTAVVCGRRREQFPDASVYIRLCDWEWDTPVGPARACGGDAMMRIAAIVAAGGYRDALIAGEEPELCLRLRRDGWEVWRLDAEMTGHDAAIYRFAQWWRRCRRGGYAFAEGSFLHGNGPEQHWVAESRRALAWALLPGVAALALAPLGPAALSALFAYPLQVFRLAKRSSIQSRASWERAAFTVLAKFPEALGVVEFHLRRRRGGRRLIEYK